MQDQLGNAVAYAVVVTLPFVGWVLSWPRVWRRVQPVLERTVVAARRQLVDPGEPAEVVLRRLAHARLARLRRDLERVRRLVADDTWMTGTRQIGNRIAYDLVVRDVRDARRVVEAYGPLDAYDEVAALTPTFSSPPPFTPSAGGSAVEVLELGPRGRWF